MKYENIVKGRFLERPNRFVAYVEIDGREEVCHVKNTGRCRELLVHGCTVYLDKAKNPERKTKYDLVAAEKGERLINMDSYAPNLAAGEFLPKIFPGSIIKSEYTYGKSRFDFYIELNSRKILLEVKGVTLEKDGVVMFPDAPTERGLKHVRELAECVKKGYEGYLLFVVQMGKVKYFTPNNETHPQFGEALKEAKRAGVKLLAYDCEVAPDGMEINGPVSIIL
ncbi:MAG: DNA/RNA nuclease SfsA [Ruminococcus sp.]|nr:DNA/RNA nuclease SfsA [Ruminococcus sp.]MCM1380983.1 DNA/RNA nuclease SfsA [Muribaculaceae bacterium]MCM1479121.1 DNA/RNA nuclease SfsA [Muribaculaceae bacterium]